MKIQIETKNKCGIYKIECETGDVYIGSSKNVYSRLHRHKSDLLNNRHKNPILTNYFNKYGIESFTTDLIELCEEKDLLDRETYYINELNSKLNCQKTPNRPTITDDIKNKISNTLKNKYKSGDVKRTVITKVYQYDMNGIYVTEYEAVTDAAIAVKGSANKIHRAINLNRQYHNYYWSKTKHLSYDLPISKNCTQVTILDLISGLEVTYESCQKAFEETGIKLESINYLLNKSKSGIYKKRYKITRPSINLSNSADELMAESMPSQSSNEGEGVKTRTLRCND